jgi:hypothetical protein
MSSVSVETLERPNPSIKGTAFGRPLTSNLGHKQMTPFNILLSRFLALCLFAGGILWMLIVGLMERLGFTGGFAGGLAAIVSVALIAWLVFGRHRSQIGRPRPVQSPPSKKYRIGSFLVTLGNGSFGLAAVLVVVLSHFADPVVGGIVVYIGGAVSLMCWIVGWALTA